eukprot:COSAG02_NODE_10087_length_2029_cov_1.665803_2_plen_196_part_00
MFARQVRVGVRSSKNDTERDVVLSPITTPALNSLKYLHWELECQRKVEELGQGEIGYVHLRAMGGENYTEFAQGYFPVWDRSGLIIDVRHNRGGNIDSWVLEKLLRRVWFCESSVPWLSSIILGRSLILCCCNQSGRAAVGGRMGRCNTLSEAMLSFSSMKKLPLMAKLSLKGHGVLALRQSSVPARGGVRFGFR